MERDEQGRLSFTAAETLALIDLVEVRKKEKVSSAVATAKNLRRKELGQMPPDSIAQILGKAASEGLVMIMASYPNDNLRLKDTAQATLDDIKKYLTS